MKIIKKLTAFLLFTALWIPVALAGNIESISSYDIFTPPNTDKSVNYLGQIFGTVGGVVHGTSGQLLSELFRVFNYGMVILASCIMVYTIIISVINTAQEGEFMGKKMNSTWVVFRAVAGIGILVPKYSGYSLIQVFIMWVAVQGVGLADKTWDRAVDYLGDGGVVYAPPAQNVNSAGGMPKTFDTAVQIFNSEVCMFKAQDMARKDRDDAVNQAKQDPQNSISNAGSQSYPVYRPVWDDANKVVSFGFPGSSDSAKAACGQYGWAKTGGQSDYYEEYKRAGLEQMLINLGPIAQTAAEMSGKTLTTQQTALLKDRIVRGLLGATADYENIMGPALNRANADNGDKWIKNLQESKAKGWIIAGSYYWDLAKINNKIASDAKDYQPSIVSALSKDQLERNGADADAIMNAVNGANKIADIKNVQELLGALEDKVGTALPPEYKANLMQTIANMSSKNPSERASAINSVQNMANNIEKPQKVFSTGTTVGMGATLAGVSAGIAAASPGMAMILIPSMASLVGLWFGTMNSPGDPIAMVQHLGQGMMGIAISIWLIGSAMLAAMTGMMSIMGSATGAGFGIQNGLKLFVPIIIGFIGVLFVNGIVLSVYVPLIPFMIFTFAAIGWIIAVLEAIVAGPLVAAAITHPEGHDLLGKAEQAVMLLLGVFLRPVVMVIGFLAAIILTRVSLRLVNAGFSHAVDAAEITGIGGSGTNLFGVVGIMVVYTMIVVSLVNMVFNAGVVKLWETIWMWVGFHQQGSSGVDQVLQEAKGGVHGGAQVGGDFAGGAVKGGADYRANQLEAGRSGQAGGLQAVKNQQTGKTSWETVKGADEQGPDIKLNTGDQ